MILWRLGDSSLIPGRFKDFSLRYRVQTTLGPVLWEVMGPERETDLSPRSSAEIKIVWSCTSTPPCVIMARCLMKEKKLSVWIYIATLGTKDVIINWGGGGRSSP
jgi:hypothetical protein